jgi:hypothetical protein
MWELGLRPRNFFFGIICFEFLILCFCSVVLHPYFLLAMRGKVSHIEKKTKKEKKEVVMAVLAHVGGGGLEPFSMTGGIAMHRVT